MVFVKQLKSLLCAGFLAAFLGLVFVEGSHFHPEKTKSTQDCAACAIAAQTPAHASQALPAIPDVISFSIDADPAPLASSVAPLTAHGLSPPRA